MAICRSSDLYNHTSKKKVHRLHLSSSNTIQPLVGRLENQCMGSHRQLIISSLICHGKPPLIPAPARPVSSVAHYVQFSPPSSSPLHPPTRTETNKPLSPSLAAACCPLAVRVHGSVRRRRRSFNAVSCPGPLLPFVKAIFPRGPWNLKPFLCLVPWALS